MSEMDLRYIRDRHQMIRFFDGYAIERMEDLSERKLKQPLVKSYLLELLDGEEARTPQGLLTIFNRRGVKMSGCSG